MGKKYLLVVFIVQLLAAYSLAQAAPKNWKPRPHVVVIGVNGMEWDFIRPLLLRGEMAKPIPSAAQRGLRQAADGGITQLP